MARGLGSLGVGDTVAAEPVAAPAEQGEGDPAGERDHGEAEAVVEGVDVAAVDAIEVFDGDAEPADEGDHGEDDGDDDPTQGDGEGLAGVAGAAPGEATAVVQTWLSGQIYGGPTSCLGYLEAGRGNFVEEMVNEGKWEVRYSNTRTVGSDKAGTLWVWQVFEGTNAVSRVTSGEEC